MKTERLLQISATGIAFLGAFALGSGRGNIYLPIAVGVAAVLSLILTDFLGIFRLNRLAANTAAFLAVLYAARNLVAAQDIAIQLLDTASVLAYLTLVLLFMQKTIRIYRYLLIIGLLQTVIAAILTPGPGYGILLPIIIFMAVLLLLTLSRHSESIHLESAKDMSYPEMSERKKKRLNGGFFFMALGYTPAVVCIGAVFFFFFPRTHNKALSGYEDPFHRLTQFTPEVNLRSRGDMVESSKTVLRIAYTDLETDSEFLLASAPYIRGAVLDRYDAGSGKWTANPRRDTLGLLWHNQARNPVRQDIDFEEIPDSRELVADRRRLFGVAPYYRHGGTSGEVRTNQQTHELFQELNKRQFGRRLQKFSYTLVTDGFLSGQQVALLPHVDQEGRPRGLSSNERSYYTRVPDAVNGKDPLEGLKKKAEEVFQENPDKEYALRIRDMALFFTTSREYTYELPSASEDWRFNVTLDPNEDFIVNHKQGHCEFFASALTLMLRSQGVPARMVIGYSGGDYNVFGGFYSVQGRHAHAWVEAYLEPDQLVADMPGFQRIQGRNGGAWLRLDPTPSALDEEAAAVSKNWWSSVYHFMECSKLVWRDYVTGFDQSRQWDMVYRPMIEAGGGFFANMDDYINSCGKFFTRSNLKRFFAWDSSRMLGGWQFLLRVGLAIGMLALMLGLLWQMWKKRSDILRFLARFFPRAAIRMRSEIRVDYYYRLMRLLARYGFERRPAQTHLEFIDGVIARLQIPQEQGAGDFLSRCVTLYYQVRFGGRELSSEENAKICRELSRLKTLLQQS